MRGIGRTEPLEGITAVWNESLRGGLDILTRLLTLALAIGAVALLIAALLGLPGA